MKSTLRNALALVLFSASAAASFAGTAKVSETDVFNFSDMSANSKSGTTLHTDSNAVLCTGGDVCSSNVDGKKFGGDLEYKVGNISVAATGYYSTDAKKLGKQVSVIQDHATAAEIKTGGAGLGVYHLSGNSSDDNITTGETLKMSFNQVVTLNSIGLRSEGHSSTWAPKETFQFSTDGKAWTSGTLAGNVAMNLSGQDFYFRYGGVKADQFYLGTMSVSTVAAVPEPETYAMLLAGLGLMGVVARRRKAKQTR